jgi:hypothetical protein
VVPPYQSQISTALAAIVPSRLAWFDGDVSEEPHDYLKPEMPEGQFVIEDEQGLWDGPFRAEELVPSTLPGRPRVFAGTGSPTVFRILKQQSNVIWTEDGDRLTFKPIG